MDKTALITTVRSLAGAASAALLIGCYNDVSTNPDRERELVATSTTFSRQPDLGTCTNLRAPAGSKLAYHTYAKGVQIYRWSGTAWSFVAPSAVLSADAKGNSTVGIHYGGPTWESNSGSKVVATVIDRCTAEPNAIPWLSLGAVSTQGPGVFARVTFIQRVNTDGGNAPTDPGSVIGEEARIPYTARYFFYRDK